MLSLLPPARRQLRRAAARAASAPAGADDPFPPPPTFLHFIPPDRPPSISENSFAKSPEAPLSLFRQRLSPNPAGADVVVLGLPFDSGPASYMRPGARFAPRAVRSVSAYISPRPYGFVMSYPDEFNVFELLDVADAGDVHYELGDTAGFLAAAQSAAACAAASGGTPVALGGDASVALPMLRALSAQHQQPLALVRFAARAASADRGGPCGGADPVAAAVADGCVAPEFSVQVGVRSAPCSGTLRCGLSLSAADVRSRGPQRIAESAKQLLGDRPCYLSLSLGCMDPTFAPGVGCPVAGGLTSAEVLDTMVALEGLNVVGGDVVDVVPAYDASDITALAAAQLAHRLLHHIYYARRRSPK